MARNRKREDETVKGHFSLLFLLDWMLLNFQEMKR